MTEQRAIEIIKENLCPMCDYGTECMDLCDIKSCDNKEAIKTLEQEPCEDCISRQDVLEFINFEDKWLTDAKSHNRDTEIAFSTLKSTISKMPSVIPKGVTVTDFADKCRECGRMKKGKWTRKAHGFPPEPYTTCSNCDYDIDFEISKLVKADAFTIEPYRPNYCPNCGAKMEVEE